MDENLQPVEDDEDDLLDVEVEDDDLPEPPAKEKPKAEAKDDDDDELDRYSESVKARLEAMKAEADAARRARDEALAIAKRTRDTAESFKSENERLKKYVAGGEQVFAERSKEAIEAQLAAAKVDLKAAFEAGDGDKLAEAQARIADLAARKREVENFRPTTFAPPADLPDIPKPAPTVDANTQKWLEKNSWFLKDEEMTAVAMAAHRRLVLQEKIDARTDPDRYFKALDDTMRARFPEKFGAKEEAKKEAPPKKERETVVSPVTRTVDNGKTVTKVRLTPSQLQICRTLGIDPKDYARQYAKENGL